MTAVTTAPVGSKSALSFMSRSCVFSRSIDSWKILFCSERFRVYFRTPSRVQAREYAGAGDARFRCGAREDVAPDTSAIMGSFSFSSKKKRRFGNRETKRSSHPELGDGGREGGPGHRLELDVVGDGPRQLHGKHVRVPGVRRGGRHDCLLIRRVDEREAALGVCVVAAPRGPHALVALGATEPFGAQRVRLVAVHGVLSRVRPRRVRVASGLARGLGAPRLLRGGAGRGARGLLRGGAGRGERGLRGGRGAARGGGGETARHSGRARGERRGLCEGVHGRGAQKGSFAGARRAVTRVKGASETTRCRGFWPGVGNRTSP